MNDLIEPPTYLAPVAPPHSIDPYSEDESRLATLSHFGSPYCEGDTPLFI